MFPVLDGSARRGNVAVVDKLTPNPVIIRGIRE